ncbi:MAG: serine hydrolase [Pirellulaceae bacterium]|nr:MAG: serine hydrolase [Pirellulaceae bacterium]
MKTRRVSSIFVVWAVTLMLAPLPVPLLIAEEPTLKIDAERAGFHPERLSAIRQRMQQFVEQGEAAGVVTLVAKDGVIAAWDAVGYRDWEAKQPMQRDTLFAIASMTKPITATAFMILVDEGKVSLDDPIVKYLPAFKETRLADGSAPRRDITIRDCLTHTSGIVGDQRNTGTLAETVERLARRPLAFHPGERWAYSPGLTVVGRIIEVVSGEPYERFLERRLFEPLGMNETTFRPAGEQLQRVARLYKPGPKPGTLAAATHWINELSDDRSPNPSAGLFSTAGDLFRFYQMVLDGGQFAGKQILSAEAVRQMVSLQTGDLATGFTPGNGWGLGWCVVREPQGVTAMLRPGTFGHGGAFGTQGWVEPERRLVFVLLVQRTEFGNSDASALRAEFQRLAVEALRP